jgi:DNA polymerase V
MIGLMDCNNFFVSCERLFRPDLIGKPVIVLSSNDGCVVSRSQEVKDLGIPMGIPHFEIKDICKKERITVFSSNFALYRDISSRVMNALKEEFEHCNIYSIDEAFFEVDAQISESEMAKVRARIIQKTGIPVSIGIAETKTLAKAVNRIAKKGTGICILDDVLYKDVILELPCGSIWGIGRQTSAFLSRHKIYTISSLLKQDNAFIKKTLGLAGERICMELRGVRVYELDESGEDEQSSYMSTRSFGSSVHDKQVLLSALSYHVTQVTKKLRRDGCVAGRITVLVRGSRFGAFSHREGSQSVTLLEPTNSTLLLIKEASKLLDMLYAEEIPYKKAGVVVSDVRPIRNTSSTLFGDVVSKEKQAKIDATIDSLTSRFGSEIVHSGLIRQVSSWMEKRTYHSKEYTTKWNDIACVKAE